MAPSRTVLLNPGPVTLSQRVRRALDGPDICHRGAEFAEVFSSARQGVATIYDEATDYDAVLITGSGTAAVEAMVASMIPEGGKGLVAANGVYGERMASMLAAHGTPHGVVQGIWTEPVDVDGVAAALDADPSITHVLTVHHETTTGRLNDLDALGRLCRERGVGMLLDAVSSYGAERIDFEGWNVEACASTANKCLHGVPGIAFVVARQDALGRASGARGLYLDVMANYQAQSNAGLLFTPAVQVVYALAEALDELSDQGGWQARRGHYRSLSGWLRRRFQDLGLGLLLEDESAYSSMLTSFTLPDMVAFDELYAPLKREGYVIYPGQGALAQDIFRVAVMGDLRSDDLEGFGRVFEDIMRVRE